MKSIVFIGLLVVQLISGEEISITCEADMEKLPYPSNVTLNLSNPKITISNEKLLERLTKVKNLTLADGTVPAVTVTSQFEAMEIWNCGTSNVTINLGWNYRMVRFVVVFNRLKRIPANIAAMKRLKELYFHDNEIEFVNLTELAGLEKLETLNLANNRIFKITSGTNQVNLPALEVFDLKFNLLTGIDFSNWRLPHLKDLYLDNNRLKSLKYFPAVLPALQQVALYENPLNCLWYQRASLELRRRNVILYSGHLNTCDEVEGSLDRLREGKFRENLVTKSEHGRELQSSENKLAAKIDREIIKLMKQLSESLKKQFATQNQDFKDEMHKHAEQTKQEIGKLRKENGELKTVMFGEIQTLQQENKRLKESFAKSVQQTNSINNSYNDLKRQIETKFKSLENENKLIKIELQNNINELRNKMINNSKKFNEEKQLLQKTIKEQGLFNVTFSTKLEDIQRDTITQKKDSENDLKTLKIIINQLNSSHLNLKQQISSQLGKLLDESGANFTNFEQNNKRILNSTIEVIKTVLRRQSDNVEQKFSNFNANFEDIEKESKVQMKNSENSFRHIKIVIDQLNSSYIASNSKLQNESKKLKQDLSNEIRFYKEKIAENYTKVEQNAEKLKINIKDILKTAFKIQNETVKENLENLRSNLEKELKDNGEKFQQTLKEQHHENSLLINSNKNEIGDLIKAIENLNSSNLNSKKEVSESFKILQVESELLKSNFSDKFEDIQNKFKLQMKNSENSFKNLKEIVDQLNSSHIASNSKLQNESKRLKQDLSNEINFYKVKIVENYEKVVQNAGKLKTNLKDILNTASKIQNETVEQNLEQMRSKFKKELKDNGEKFQQILKEQHNESNLLINSNKNEIGNLKLVIEKLNNSYFDSQLKNLKTFQKIQNYSKEQNNNFEKALKKLNSSINEEYSTLKGGVSGELNNLKRQTYENYSKLERGSEQLEEKLNKEIETLTQNDETFEKKMINESLQQSKMIEGLKSELQNFSSQVGQIFECMGETSKVLVRSIFE